MYAACYLTANAFSNSNVEYNTELLRICDLDRQGSTGSTMSIGLSVLETSGHDCELGSAEGARALSGQLSIDLFRAGVRGSAPGSKLC